MHFEFLELFCLISCRASYSIFCLVVVVVGGGGGVETMCQCFIRVWGGGEIF